MYDADRDGNLPWLIVDKIVSIQRDSEEPEHWLKQHGQIWWEKQLIYNIALSYWPDI